VPKVMPGGSSAGGRGRRGRVHSVSSTLAEINVVPLVDVMLVLLIIFMVAAPMMQQGYNVNLPTSRRAPALPAEEPIYVTVPVSYARTKTVQLGNESVRLAFLQERVRQLMQNRTKKQIYLRSDGQVTVQQMMEVFESLKNGGVENVGMVTRPPG